MAQGSRDLSLRLKKSRGINGIYISAAKRNSGKTTISIAITRILRDMGLSVRVFKKGPDFIDPMWLSAASGTGTYNLDAYFMPSSKIRKHFLDISMDSDVSVIEGNHGLHDSIDVLGSTSNAAMSKLLGLPVILVIDVGELNRGVVPLILGFRDFDRDVNIKGVILNKVHSKRHEKNLLRAIKHYTDVKIVGAIPNNPELSIKQRHLGLMSTLSPEEIENLISETAAKIRPYIDMNAVIGISMEAAKSYPGVKKIKKPQPFEAYELPGGIGKGRFFPARPALLHGSPASSAVRRRSSSQNIKIAVAYDRAFNFYYNENIDALEKLGCEIACFSPLNDASLPAGTDAVYIGGGFPEIFARELEANSAIRACVKREIENGMPVYAECGGLMYLCNSIEYGDVPRKMVGAIDADVKLTKKPKGHGYTKLSSRAAAAAPGGPDGKPQARWHDRAAAVKGHEFHHSFLEMAPGRYEFAFDVKKGYGVDGAGDGIIYKNTLACYNHVYSPASPGWFRNWTAFIKKLKKEKR